MNPILPLKHFIPDVEARVWNDGRLYLYGSMDVKNHMDYCSHFHKVFSSDDGLEWQDYGIAFSSDEVPWSNAPLYAPDCVYKNGIYYLYFCTADRTIGVATSCFPQGPFEKAVRIEGLDAIDPAVLVDGDDAYIYWGQFNDVRAAKLKSNMCEVDWSTVTQPLTHEGDFFHEGSSMRRIGDKYYYVYAYEGREATPTCLAYAIGNNPLGPFEYQGVIIDNAGCDPENWNNHGSICHFQDQWYVFYHRSSRASKFNRRVCAEKIRIDKDGRIEEVPMSSKGMAPVLHASDKLPLPICSHLDKNMWLEDCVEEDAYEQVYCEGDGSFYITGLMFDFEHQVQIILSATDTHGKIEIMSNKGGLLASGHLSEMKDGQLTLSSKAVTGVEDIEVKMTGLMKNQALRIKWIQWYK